MDKMGSAACNNAFSLYFNVHHILGKLNYVIFQNKLELWRLSRTKFRCLRCVATIFCFKTNETSSCGLYFHYPLSP